VDGARVTGWFTEDFTLAELRTLRARERIPALRPANSAYDGRFPVPTFQEVLDLAGRWSRRTGRTVGVYPETKHPTYFASIGLALERPLVHALQRNGLDRGDAEVCVQSFEVGNLRRLARMTRVRLVQLLDASGRPYDFTAAGDPRTYATLATPAGLRDVARYANGVGVHKDLVMARDADGSLAGPTALVRDAHAVGLTVHAWTFRRENAFLPADHRRGSDPAAPGDLGGEIEDFLRAGVDGVFSDNPDVAVDARDAARRVARARGARSPQERRVS
jgi:glycerophosphoryl diester phosphodiesterase